MYLVSERRRKYSSLLLEEFTRTQQIIAEIKKASPSRGVLIEGSFLPFLEEYEEGEAVATSVVIEEDYFGESEMFREVRKNYPFLFSVKISQ